MKPLAAAIREKGFKGEVLTDEPLYGHCSLRVGGRADLLAAPEGLEDLVILADFLEENGLPWFVLGGGTNVLFANGGFRGCVVRLGAGFSGVSREGEAVLAAGASAPLPALVSFAGREGLEGLECLAGIPGTVGGGVRMNAGTASGDISFNLEAVELFRDGSSCTVKKGDLGFAYRSSGLRDGEIVLGARFLLEPSSPEKVLERVRGQILLRKDRQPLGLPSAGCWFRNPEGSSAGRLIDEAGMKGTRCGGAEVSPVHANFLVNVGGATARDFLELAEKVRQAVWEKSGVRLEEEVRVVHG